MVKIAKDVDIGITATIIVPRKTRNIDRKIRFKQL